MPKNIKNTNKNVTWHPDVKETTVSFFKTKKSSGKKRKLYWDKLWQKISSYIKEAEWKNLDKCLEELGKENYQALLDKKGHLAFVNAMAFHDINYMVFILNKMPKEFSLKKFRENNYGRLRRFLKVLELQKEYGRYTPEREETRIKILSLLLELDPSEVKKYMEENKDKSFMTDDVLDEYRRALELYNQNNLERVDGEICNSI